MENKQRFNKGDYVRIAKDLGHGMDHFIADCDAIVIGSYADKYGGNDTKSYTLHIKGHNQHSWYHEHQLELIEHDRLDLLEEWKHEEQLEEEMKGDLNWIFSHGNEVLESPHGATISTLAKCFGLDNLWGSRGEGITYYLNARQTLELATPFLKDGDKDGWLVLCEQIKEAYYGK